MKWRIFVVILLLFSLAVPVAAAPIRWVDFGVPYESLRYAMERDVATFEEEKHIPWIDILALAATRTGGKCSLSSVKKAFTLTSPSPKSLPPVYSAICFKVNSIKTSYLLSA